MKALRLHGFTGPSALRWEEVAAPVPAASEVRVRVRATALNRADLLQTLGRYPAPPGATPDIPGLEYAGEVLEVGERVTRVKPGDRVMGLVGGGAFAEQLCVSEREVLPVPEGMSFTDAAALPEAFLTAWDALVLQGGLRAGETVLVHAAGSGVGAAAVQVAVAAGARVVGTSRTADKLSRLAAFGLHAGVLTGEGQDAAADVLAATRGRGVDLVLDLVGGSAVSLSLKVLAPRGRLLLVGLLDGAAPQVDLGLVLRKRLQLTGTVMRSRSPEEKATLAAQAERMLLPLFASGALRPAVDVVLPLPRAAEGFARMAANGTFGKIVLQVD
ncbi:MAG: NAD(P)H-quinone oxidoreductase [Deltaproteobacteria bacterium]|nr:NAD(P)H-quinone oxidoreductase [Deltaproteobacteria bacterium]